MSFTYLNGPWGGGQGNRASLATKLVRGQEGSNHSGRGDRELPRLSADIIRMEPMANLEPVRSAGARSMAEGLGFEPRRRSRAQRFSRPPPSTTRPSLRAVGVAAPSSYTEPSSRRRRVRPGWSLPLLRTRFTKAAGRCGDARRAGPWAIAVLPPAAPARHRTAASARPAVLGVPTPRRPSDRSPPSACPSRWSRSPSRRVASPLPRSAGPP